MHKITIYKNISKLIFKANTRNTKSQMYNKKTKDQWLRNMGTESIHEIFAKKTQ